ncbi:MAG: ABC transporter ATP-binding protein/permease [Alistipes sp.]|jgi:ABC-type multidrug transport system fused ATPase/permease subunit|nr:ABC transporter ATP-binding protein/permease [Alistipes sp.]
MSLADLFRNIAAFVRPYRWLVALTLALTLVGSLTAQVNAWVLRYAVDRIAALLDAHEGVREGLAVLVLISAVLVGKELVNSVIQYGQKWYGEKLRILVSRDLAQRVIEKVMTYRLAFFTTGGNASGKLQTRIDRGIESLSKLVQNFFIDILPLVASSVVALAMMFQANLYVGLVGLCIVPIYFWASAAQARKLKGRRRGIRDLRETKSQGILSIFDSIAVIKSFTSEELEARKQLSLQNDLTTAQMTTRHINFLYDGLKSFVEQIGVVIIIILTAYLVLTGQMTIGAIMFHILLFNNVTAPIRQLHRIYDQINDALIYSESFFDTLNAEGEVEPSGSYRPERVRGHFELRGVDFTYPDNAEPTLTGIRMDIRPGKITALVGLSGAGKSTLVNLLDKFYTPDRGCISLDGVPLSDYDTEALRDNIGLVLQKNHIFAGTVMENIRYGNPDATPDEVETAARSAYLHNQIAALPDGYDTPATRLSGGQQQKIAIARMFLKNPPILFLDEPTASLDAISTEQIKASIDAIKQNRTVVVISHSISQIIDSDAIYVMQGGRIVESGTHDELYRIEDGAYRSIFDSMARSLNIDKITKTLEGE